jgi:hypothetical protein
LRPVIPTAVADNLPLSMRWRVMLAARGIQTWLIR